MTFIHRFKKLVMHFNLFQNVNLKTSIHLIHIDHSVLTSFLTIIVAYDHDLLQSR